jgi:hypothetical protein
MPRIDVPTLVGVFLGVMFFGGCHPTPTNPEVPLGRQSMSNPSYSLNVQPLFTQYCALAGCHAGLPPAGSLNLEESMSHSQLFDVTAVKPVTCVSDGVTTVVTRRVYGSRSNAYESVLVHRLEGTCTSLPRMPFGMPPLEPGQIETIRNWILSGAPNN